MCLARLPVLSSHQYWGQPGPLSPDLPGSEHRRRGQCLAPAQQAQAGNRRAMAKAAPGSKRDIPERLTIVVAEKLGAGARRVLCIGRGHGRRVTARGLQPRRPSPCRPCPLTRVSLPYPAALGENPFQFELAARGIERGGGEAFADGFRSGQAMAQQTGDSSNEGAPAFRRDQRPRFSRATARRSGDWRSRAATRRASSRLI